MCKSKSSQSHNPGTGSHQRTVSEIRRTPQRRLQRGSSWAKKKKRISVLHKYINCCTEKCATPTPNTQHTHICRNLHQVIDFAPCSVSVWGKQLTETKTTCPISTNVRFLCSLFLLQVRIDNIFSFNVVWVTITSLNLGHHRGIMTSLHQWFPLEMSTSWFYQESSGKCSSRPPWKELQ